MKLHECDCESCRSYAAAEAQRPVNLIIAALNKIAKGLNQANKLKAFELKRTSVHPEKIDMLLED